MNKKIFSVTLSISVLILFFIGFIFAINYNEDKNKKEKIIEQNKIIKDIFEKEIENNNREKTKEDDKKINETKSVVFISNEKDDEKNNNEENDNKKIENNSIKDIDIKEDNQNKHEEIKNESYQNNNKETDKDVKDNFLVEKFQDNKDYVVEVIDNDFVQVGNDLINNKEINGDCVLDILQNETDLGLYDFVFDECNDIKCEKFDFIKDKNDWYRVVFYGDFFGNGDKLYFKKENNVVISANLECENKEDEKFENVLFKKLIE